MARYWDNDICSNCHDSYVVRGNLEEEEKSEYEEIMQKLEFVEKELKEIRDRLEKIEGGL